MARTVVALFDDFSSASDAVRDLVDNGFTRNDISILASDQTGEYGRYLSTRDMSQTTDEGAVSGAGVGAGIGAVIGGLAGILVGLGALTIPGIGPVLAAGPLSAAVAGLAGAGAGAVAGGVTGGLIGALADMGIPEDNAQYFAEGVRRGGTLVTLRTSDEMSNRARDILNNHNPVDMNVRVTEWRDEGWSGYDTAAGSMMGSTGRSADVSASEPLVDMESRVYSESPDIETSRTTDTPTYTDFTTYSGSFRNHFSTSMYANTYTYEQYEPAYRYGYDLATNSRYRERNWDEIELEAQRYWDERNPGTWDRIKNAVRHAWEEVKDTVS
ncbi:MAG: hypothetical protein EHM41_03015 [Chloroflexi bacterium]|nr:MAG: hypothetical protein EHM41_03015 [Chloroflexota bacterium]